MWQIKFNFKEGGDPAKGNVNIKYRIDREYGKVQTYSMGVKEFWNSSLEMSDNQRVFPSCMGKVNSFF